MFRLILNFGLSIRSITTTTFSSVGLHSTTMLLIVIDALSLPVRKNQRVESINIAVNHFSMLCTIWWLWMTGKITWGRLYHLWWIFTCTYWPSHWFLIIWAIPVTKMQIPCKKYWRRFSNWSFPYSPSWWPVTPPIRQQLWHASSPPAPSKSTVKCTSWIRFWSMALEFARITRVRTC